MNVMIQWQDIIDTFDWVIEEITMYNHWTRKYEEFIYHPLFSFWASLFSFSIEESIEIFNWHKNKVFSENILKKIDRMIDDYILFQIKYINSGEKNIKKVISWNIYLLKSNWLYKIWKAKKIDQRIKTYRTENPFWIEVIWTWFVNSYSEVEKYLLQKYKDKKIRWEWFNLCEEDLDWINKYLTTL